MMEQTHEMRNTPDSFLPFDPIVVVQDVLKRWLIILLAAIAVGVGTYIMTDMEYAPRYQAKATFVVTSRSSAATVYSNLTSTTEMASVFSELINSSVMRKNIQEVLGGYFSATISASAVPQTNLLNMTVTASDPRTAFLVAQAIIDHHEEITYQVVDGVSLEILQGVEVPTVPVNRANAVSRMEKMMLLAGAAAVVLFAALSLLRDTIRSGREARKKLDCEYLGEVPHERKFKTLFSVLRRRKTGILVTNPVTSFHYVETMRKLSRRVEQHMGSGKVLMFTSVLENEGKSTIAVNVALTMAQKGKKVLLVDCDLRKPACHLLLEQKVAAGGFRALLRGEATCEEVLLTYKRSNLYMLLDEKGDAASGDLLNSGAMEQLLDWARQKFDLVVLDLPPMSVAADAETVSDLADASLLVVRQNTVGTASINKAAEVLEGGKAKLLGCVLNNVHSTFLSTGQGYQYGGYGHYNYYGSYGEKSSRK